MVDDGRRQAIGKRLGQECASICTLFSVLGAVMLVVLWMIHADGTRDPYHEVVYAVPGGYYQVHRKTTLPSGLKYVSSTSPQKQREMHASIPFPMNGYITSACPSFQLKVCNNGTNPVQIQQTVSLINVEHDDNDDRGLDASLQPVVIFDYTMGLQSGECRPEPMNRRQTHSHIVRNHHQESIASLYSIEQYVSFGDGTQVQSFVDSDPCDVDSQHVLVYDPRTSGPVQRQVSDGIDIFYSRSIQGSFFRMWIATVIFFGCGMLYGCYRCMCHECIIDSEIKYGRY